MPSPPSFLFPDGGPPSWVHLILTAFVSSFGPWGHIQSRRPTASLPPSRIESGVSGMDWMAPNPLPSPSPSSVPRSLFPSTATVILFRSVAPFPLLLRLLFFPPPSPLSLVPGRQAPKSLLALIKPPSSLPPSIRQAKRGGSTGEDQLGIRPARPRFLAPASAAAAEESGGKRIEEGGVGGSKAKSSSGKKVGVCWWRMSDWLRRRRRKGEIRVRRGWRWLCH